MYVTAVLTVAVVAVFVVPTVCMAAPAVPVAERVSKNPTLDKWLNEMLRDLEVIGTKIEPAKEMSRGTTRSSLK